MEATTLKSISTDFFLQLLLAVELPLLHRVTAIQKFLWELDTNTKNRQYLITSILPPTLLNGRWLIRKEVSAYSNFMSAALFLVHILLYLFGSLGASLTVSKKLRYTKTASDFFMFELNDGCTSFFWGWDFDACLLREYWERAKSPQSFQFNRALFPRQYGKRYLPCELWKMFWL